MTNGIKVVPVNSVSWAINNIMNEFQSRNIKGIAYQVLRNDGSYTTGGGGQFTELEILGILEQAKLDLK